MRDGAPDAALLDAAGKLHVFANDRSGQFSVWPVPDNLGKDQAWRATPALRRAYLADLRKAQAKQAQSYAWVDQKKGVVQIPIDQAMDLVIAEKGSRK